MNLNRVTQTNEESDLRTKYILYSPYWECYPVSSKRTHFLFLLCSPDSPAVVTVWLTWYQYSAEYFGSCSSPSTFLPTARCQVWSFRSCAGWASHAISFSFVGMYSLLFDWLSVANHAL